MSHPEGISVLLRRRISLTRRRMRFRTTAPPRAFLTLMPNRLVGPGPLVSFTGAPDVAWLAVGARAKASR